MYKANAAKLSEGEKDELIAFFKNIDDMGDKLDPQDPSTFKDTVEFDAMTLDEFCHKFLPGRVAALMANATARGFLGVESTQISSLFYIDYVRSGFKMESLTSDLNRWSSIPSSQTRYDFSQPFKQFVTDKF
jgi:hypothetical protein